MKDFWNISRTSNQILSFLANSNSWKERISSFSKAIFNILWITKDACYQKRVLFKSLKRILTVRFISRCFWKMLGLKILIWLLVISWFRSVYCCLSKGITIKGPWVRTGSGMSLRELLSRFLLRFWVVIWMGFVVWFKREKRVREEIFISCFYQTQNLKNSQKSDATNESTPSTKIKRKSQERSFPSSTFQKPESEISTHLENMKTTKNANY